jgi:phytochrome-interacting factor 4
MQDGEFESAEATCEPAQKLTTAKRRRAAEVHNLSERVGRLSISSSLTIQQGHDFLFSFLRPPLSLTVI